MRYILAAAAMLSALLSFSPAAHAGDGAPVFRILRWGEYSRGGSALVKKHNDHKGAMKVLSADPALAAALTSRGVEINNVVGVVRTMDGSLIVYLK